VGADLIHGNREQKWMATWTNTTKPTDTFSEYANVPNKNVYILETISANT
jgi:hypothetical protein